jgi:hypothetical protein
MAMAVDGSVSASATSTTVVLSSLTTTQANDYIIVAVGANSADVVLGNVQTVVGSSLGSFTRIALLVNGSNQESSIWAKFSTGTLASEVITLTANVTSYISSTAFGVSGSGQSSLVWDANTPKTQASYPPTYVNVTPDCFLIGNWGDWQNNSITTSPAGGVNIASTGDYRSTVVLLRSTTGTTTFTTGTGDSNNHVFVGIPLAGGGGGGTLTAKKVLNSQAVRRAAYW